MYIVKNFPQNKIIIVMSGELDNNIERTFMKRKLFFIIAIVLFFTSFIFMYNFLSEKYVDLSEIVDASSLKRLSGEVPKEFSLRDKIYGMHIVFKLDIPYLINSISDNLGETIKEEINEYLEKALTEEEYKGFINLIEKYIK